MDKYSEFWMNKYGVMDLLKHKYSLHLFDLGTLVKALDLTWPKLLLVRSEHINFGEHYYAEDMIVPYDTKVPNEL